MTDKAGKPDSVLTSPILTSRLLIYNNIVYFVDTRSQTSITSSCVIRTSHWICHSAR